MVFLINIKYADFGNTILNDFKTDKPSFIVISNTFPIGKSTQKIVYYKILLVFKSAKKRIKKLYYKTDSPKFFYSIREFVT